MRDFTASDGRRWRANLHYLPAGSTGLVGHDVVLASTSVLRFTSDDLTLDLADWPDDWFQLPDEGLVTLLHRATGPAFLPLTSRFRLPYRWFTSSVEH